MHQSFEQRQSNSAITADFPPATGQPVVLDTNVAFDLLVFRDPAIALISAHLESGQWCWVATASMRAEFDAVLARPAFRRWASQGGALNASWARWASIIDPPAMAHQVLRCADPDDQMFIDLALALQPSRLFSRDRELLRLAQRALALGVTITTPASCDPAEKKAATRAAFRG